MKIIILVVAITMVFLFGMTELEYYRESNLIELENKKNSITISNSTSSKVSSSSSSTITTITVSIDGEVNSPGTYTLDNHATIEQLIEKAGGLTDDADFDCINLYFSINEEYESIYIPKTNGDNKISINTANAETLDLLPGVGASLASKIIDYRETNGDFELLEQIKKVSGIGNSLFDKIKDFIRL